MRKYAYIFGSIEVIVGALVLCATSIIKEVAPLLGQIVYQVAAAGDYSHDDYIVSFPLVNGIAFALIIAGVVQILYDTFSVKG